MPLPGRLRGLLAKLRGRRDVRQVGVMTLGTIGAQVVLLGTAPLLSRIFTPADFGRLSVLVAVSSVAGSVAHFCYRYAILMAKSEGGAIAAYRLSMLLSVLGGAAAALGYAVLATAFGQNAALPPWSDILMQFVGIVLTAHLTILGTVQSRLDHFRQIAIGKFNTSALPAFAQIGFGLAGMQAFGLQLGRLAGQALTEAFMLRGLPAPYRLAALLRPRWRRLRHTLLRYRDSPLLMPRIVMTRAASSLPPVLLLGAYGPHVAGLYFFAERIIERPAVLLSDTVSQVPIKFFSEKVRERRPVRRLALAYTLAIAAAVIPPVIVLALIAPWMFRVFFGPQWVEAAPYAVLLAASVAARLVFLPITTMLVVMRVHMGALAVDTFFFLRVLVIPLAAGAGYAPDLAVLVFVALSVLYILASAFQGYRAMRRYENEIAGGPA